MCYTLWPQSATTRLQTQISATIDSFSTLFRLLNATFLLDRPPNDASYASLQHAAQAHSAAFTQLKADLAEAQEERVVDPRIGYKQRARYAAVTDSLTRLAQHLTGMRGGTGLQSDLLRGSKQGLVQVVTSDSSGSDSDEEKAPRDTGTSRLKGDRDLSKAGNLFWEFRDQVADELRQLTVGRALRRFVSLTLALQDLSCKVLHDVKVAMTDLNSSADHSTLLREDHDLLRAALARFTKTTILAINRLYHGTLDGRDSAGGSQGHGGPSEAVYLIYLLVAHRGCPLSLTVCASFIFTLEEFVREEIQLVEAMGEVGERSLVRSRQTDPFTARGWKSRQLATLFHEVVLALLLAQAGTVGTNKATPRNT